MVYVGIQPMRAPCSSQPRMPFRYLCIGLWINCLATTSGIQPSFLGGFPVEKGEGTMSARALLLSLHPFCLRVPVGFSPHPQGKGALRAHDPHCYVRMS